MKIVFKEHKRKANIVKHGFDFADFEYVFSFERFASAPAKTSRTGRMRFTLIRSWSDEIVVAVILSPLGKEALSVVSIRPANAKERDAYDKI